MTQSIVKKFALVNSAGLFMGGTPTYPVWGNIENAGLYHKYVGAKAALRMLNSDHKATIQELTVEYTCETIESGTAPIPDTAAQQMSVMCKRAYAAEDKLAKLQAELAAAVARANAAEAKLASMCISAPGNERFQLLELD